MNRGDRANRDNNRRNDHQERRNNRGNNRNNARHNNGAEGNELEQRTVKIYRVTKVVKGGRHMRFSVIVVVGDRNGHVGVGKGKATEIPDAIRKAAENAKKNMITVPLVDGTIPHEVIGTSGAGRVLLKPAGAGTGVIAGGPVRAVCELAGIKDIRTKSLGSNNARNVVNATIQGLKSLMTVEQVAKKRGKTPGQIYGRKVQEASNG